MKVKINKTKDAFLNDVKMTAEGYFDRGEFFCSEAVLQVINDALDRPLPADIVRLASGFPVGIGKAQCLCGAVSGGIMALSIPHGRVHGEAMKPQMFPAAKDLHDYIREKYKATCCRIITKQWAGDNFASPERKAHCVHITGDVAEWVANRLIEDGVIECVGGGV